MYTSANATYTLPADDQGPFADLDRIRIDMLNEAPPEPADQLFGEHDPLGAHILPRLRFFRWLYQDLYSGDIGAWEGSLERRDERLKALHGTRVGCDEGIDGGSL